MFLKPDSTKYASKEIRDPTSDRKVKKNSKYTLTSLIHAPIKTRHQKGSALTREGSVRPVGVDQASGSGPLREFELMPKRTICAGGECHEGRQGQ